jgi:hypothetical protein
MIFMHTQHSKSISGLPTLARKIVVAEWLQIEVSIREFLVEWVLRFVFIGFVHWWSQCLPGEYPLICE